MSSAPGPKIVLAGASGYIGKALIPRLLEKFPSAEITALSRSAPVSQDPRVLWKSCDLFSLKSIEQSLPEKTDLAIYLVHSMGPTAQLDQGSFADYDLILADNFGRALSRAKPKQLIYLGGLIPESTSLSLHLQSRLEMEETFTAHKIPTTIFRAGLILGEAGSSSQILLKLVLRLPLMICPLWTQTLTTPIDLDSTLTALASSALSERCYGKIYDLAGCRPLTYIQMMKETAIHLGKRRTFITVPFFTPTLSRLWVSLITNSSRGLVYPLVESLEHQMVARQENLFSQDAFQHTYLEMLSKVTFKPMRGIPLFRFQPQRNTVRSIQRLPLPQGETAESTRERYLKWLPKFLSPLIRVTQKRNLISFSLLFDWPVLLRLEFSSGRSSSDRQLFYITGGLLASRIPQGRLEFREVLGRRYVLAAIHDFRPALPWILYKFTQAKIHLFVMNSFQREIENSKTITIT